MTDMLETTSLRIPLSSYAIRKNIKKSYKNLENSKWVFLLISRVRITPHRSITSHSIQKPVFVA